MYANILLSTDGSEVARKGIEHGIASLGAPARWLVLRGRR